MWPELAESRASATATKPLVAVVRKLNRVELSSTVRESVFASSVACPAAFASRSPNAPWSAAAAVAAADPVPSVCVHALSEPDSKSSENTASV